MFDPHPFALFLLASAALIATPGPDMLLMTARSLGGGPRDGVLVTVGLICGVLLHTGLVAFGLAALLAASPAAFAAAKWIGAGYLVWLGARALREPIAPLDLPERSQRYRARELLAQGFLSNALNPKVALFFFTFLPQFADGQRAPLAAQIVVLGMIFAALGLASYAALAFAIGRARRLLVSGARRALTRLTGGLMIALGLRLALAER